VTFQNRRSAAIGFALHKRIDTNETLSEIYVTALVWVSRADRRLRGTFRRQEASAMRNWLVTCAALAACGILVPASASEAAVIDYIFTGTGSGLLDGTDFDGTFTVTMVADTSTVTSGGGEFRNDVGTMTFVSGALSDTILAPVVVENTASPGFMGFAQNLAPFSDESLTAAIFETYNLMTALPSTTGGLSVAPATFTTAGGHLVFGSITALSFEATGGVPEASTWAMMLAGFAGIGFLAYGRTTNARVAA
jgi:hypothetical protein